jgi:hypothetical protein
MLFDNLSELKYLERAATNQTEENVDSLDYGNARYLKVFSFSFSIYTLKVN